MPGLTNLFGGDSALDPNLDKSANVDASASGDSLAHSIDGRATVDAEDGGDGSDGGLLGGLADLIGLGSDAGADGSGAFEITEVDDRPYLQGEADADAASTADFEIGSIISSMIEPDLDSFLG